MATREVLALNESTPQIEAAQSGDTYILPRAQVNEGKITFSGASADTAAADIAAMGYTAVEGLILTGQGSTGDVTCKNDADARVWYVPTGTQNVTFDGVITTTNAALTTPALGTPSAGVLSSCTAYPGDSSLVVSGALNSGTIATGFGVINNGASDITTTGTIAGGGFVGDINGVAMTTGEGTGWSAATVSSEITKQGKTITTQVFIDIQGLVVSTTESDIIGDSGQANSHGGQFLIAESGQYLSGSITCLEAPTTGVADIDFTVSSASTGTESADVDALADAVVLLENTEAWTIGMIKPMALLPDATSDYLYLSAGVAGTPGTYGAGQFLVELIGYEA